MIDPTRSILDIVKKRSEEELVLPNKSVFFGKQNEHMTNNNWIETMKTIGKISSIHPEIVDEFILITKDLLTKKDQDNKAELDNLYSNIEDLKKRRKSARSHTDGLDESEISYNIGIEETLAILDSHINKLSTE